MTDFTPLDDDNAILSMTGGNTEPGTYFGSADQAVLLLAFPGRYTGDHKPDWAMVPDIGGSEYPLQFASDADWLAHTRFAVGLMTRRLDRRVRRCWEFPTWPGDPEAHGRLIRDLPWFIQAFFAPNLRHKGWAALRQKWLAAEKSKEAARMADDDAQTAGMSPEAKLAFLSEKYRDEA